VGLNQIDVAAKEWVCHIPQFRPLTNNYFLQLNK